MKKIKKTSELLWLLGIIFVALGVAICSKADLGVSMITAPAFVIYEAVSPMWEGASVGAVEYIIQGIMLIVLCVVIGRFCLRYLLAFGVAVLYGYILDLFILLFENVVFETVAVRWMMLIVGDIITAFGVACFFRTYMPLQVYELFVAELADRFKLNINKTKGVFDISLLVISVTLALTLFGDAGSFDWSKIAYTSFHSIGLGTLVTTVINSPIIAFMGKIIDTIFDPTPMMPKLESFLHK